MRKAGHSVGGRREAWPAWDGTVNRAGGETGSDNKEACHTVGLLRKTWLEICLFSNRNEKPGTVLSSKAV